MTIAAAADGCEAIVHAAALVKLWVRDRRSFDRVNVDGLANVLSVARERGARVLWASSFFALGPTDGRVLDVDDRRTTEWMHSARPIVFTYILFAVVVPSFSTMRRRSSAGSS